MFKNLVLLAVALQVLMLGCNRGNDVIITPTPWLGTYEIVEADFIRIDTESDLQIKLKLLTEKYPTICGKVVDLNFTCTSEIVRTNLHTWLANSAYVDRNYQSPAPILWIAQIHFSTFQDPIVRRIESIATQLMPDVADIDHVYYVYTYNFKVLCN